MALTERQQQIKQLLDKDQTPTEIATALDITVNAVYQQIRRMKTKPGTTRRRATPAAAAPKATPATPLQAVRGRASEIAAEVRQSEADVAKAGRALKAEQEKHEKLVARHKDEVAQLARAEAVLVGRPATPKSKPKPKRVRAKAPKPARVSTTNGTSPAAVGAPAPATPAAA